MKIPPIKTLILMIWISHAYIIQAQKYSISKIEPPHWWVGMQNSNLQLMVYGEEIADLQPVLKTACVKIVKSHRVENRNYLFIDLNIIGECKAGPIEFNMERDGQVVQRFEYHLMAREEGSSLRQGFDNSDVMYLITPDRFVNGDPSNDHVIGMREGPNRNEEFGRHGGDIQGIKDKLGYISKLGFTAIWLNPVLENDQPKASYHGYATTDYYKVDRRFGSNKDYRDLVASASEKGIKVIMDFIANHCGHKHWWMDDLPTKDWINFDNVFHNTNHKKTTILDPYTSSYDRKYMEDGWFVKTMPDLNQRNMYLSTYLIQNTIWWIEFSGISGIRQDTYSYPDRDFISDWTCAIMDEYPHFNIVGEEWTLNPAIIAYWQEGKQNPDGYSSCLPSLMDFPMNATLSKALKDEESWDTGFITLYEMLSNDFIYADPTQLLVFPDNHDMSRIFTQLGEDYDLFKMALSYIVTIRGIPQFYYGTEILMNNKASTSHGLIRSDYPGGWEGDSINAFTNQGMTDLQFQARDFMTALLNWRSTKEVIHTGKLMHFVPDKGCYVYFRYNASDTVMVILNKQTTEVTLDIERFAEILSGFKTGIDVLTKKQYIVEDFIQVPARTALILDLE